MKKILTILLLSAVALIGSQATWQIEGFDKNFQSVIQKNVVFNYTGQPINIANMKTVSANQYKFTYTGVDSVRGNAIFYGINPKEVLWGDTVVYVRVYTGLYMNVTE
jgi:hypothetical protein